MISKKNLFYLSCGFLTGAAFTYIAYKHPTHIPMLSHEPHFFAQHTGQPGVKAFIMTNPVCKHCQDFDYNIFKELKNSNTAFEAIFYPENQVDLWLGGILNTLPEQKRLGIFHWLKKNAKLWENLTDIKKTLQLLTQHNILPEHYINSIDHRELLYKNYTYTKLLSDSFNIIGIPSIVCTITFTGNMKWEEVKPTIDKLKQIYNTYKKQRKKM